MGVFSVIDEESRFPKGMLCSSITEEILTSVSRFIEIFLPSSKFGNCPAFTMNQSLF